MTARLIPGLSTLTGALPVAFALIAVVVLSEPGLSGEVRVTFDALLALIWCLFLGQLVLTPRAERPKGAMLLVDLAAVIVPLLAFLGVFLIGADLPDPSLACGVWVLKLLRDSTAFRLVAKVLANEARNLLGVMSIFAVVLFVAALIAYAVERNAQPQTFGSIPQAMWWAIVTLSTTGYGDAVPQSFVGRVLAGVVMMSGIGVFALWAGILATGFAEEVRRHDFVNNWQLVSAVPLFRQLGSAELVSIVRALRPRNAPAGAVLCRKGRDRRPDVLHRRGTCQRGRSRRTCRTGGRVVLRRDGADQRRAALGDGDGHVRRHSADAAFAGLPDPADQQSRYRRDNPQVLRWNGRAVKPGQSY